jgi:hypothetical protein
MRRKIYPYCEFTGRRNASYSTIIPVAVFFLVGFLILNSCTKNDDEAVSNPLESNFVSILPSNLEDSVIIDPIVSVTFKDGTDPQIISSAEISLKNGTIIIPGSLTVTGSTAQFIPAGDLKAESEYIATVTTKHSSGDDIKEYSWKFKTGRDHSYSLLRVVSVSPLNNSTAVNADSSLKVTFNKEVTISLKNVTSITLRNGTTEVAGIVSFSGKTAKFNPDAPLAMNTTYTGSVQIGLNSFFENQDDDDYDDEDNEKDNKFTWSFTTAGEAADIIAPTVSSVSPGNNALSVPAGVNPAVTFSETMDPNSLTSSTFTLKQGTSVVAGSVSAAGANATFKPDMPLTADKVYTGTISTGAKDVAGNALPSNYSWSFTTAAASDVIAPAVSSVVPANNATVVPVNSKAVVTFSEVMDAASLTTSTFNLKQGSTIVPGVVTYTGTTATFTPSSVLAGNTVYTGTVTSGAKDAAGNALAANYTWSFTTVAVATGKSFATDVMPILGICNTCHTHKWISSTNASTFYTNLVNSGHVNPTSPTSGSIYTKLNGGHPGSTVTTAQVNTILTWVTEGSKNN